MRKHFINVVFCFTKWKCILLDSPARVDLTNVHLDTVVEEGKPTSILNMDQKGNVQGIDGMYAKIWNDFKSFMNFTYSMRVSPERVFGSKDLETGEWNGMEDDTSGLFSFADCSSTDRDTTFQLSFI